ncbi:MAG: EAL domain-containing protein [Rhodocyclaceae bacterium]|nr:EAL domain-containing protein [Rhodocyclaceae bacterium]
MNELSTAAGRPAWLGSALGLGVLAAVLTWLFLRADAVSPHTHYQYLARLRALQQADVELNAAVLAQRTGLSHNYDPLVRQVEATREGSHAIAELPAFLFEDARTALTEKIRALIELHQQKARLVDHFQRSHAVLRNSRDYFPDAAEHFLREVAAGRPYAAEAGRFVRALLAFGHSGDADALPRLKQQVAALAALKLPTRERAALDHLLVHANVIMTRQTEADELARRILQLPTAKLQEEISRLYGDAHEQAQRRAGHYRILLYVVALLLAAYLVWAYLRIEQDQRELARAHRTLIERFEAQRAAEERLRLFATVFSNASEGMTITDAATRIVAVNPAFTAITGYSESEAIGQTPALLNSGRHEPAFYRQMWQSIETTGKWRGEIWNRRKDGVIYPEWLSITAVHDESGRITHYIGIFSDITERKEAEQRILYLAHHDALTGLPNRLLLDDRIEQALLKAKRSNQLTGLLFIDLDRFKNINETLGHEIGDELLVQAAKRLAATLRETDTLARHGGDAFVVVLPDLAQPQDATQVARKLLAALGQPYRLAGHDLTVTGSIGIALFPEDGDSASELLRNAETAMYHAKEEGRNTLRFYAADMNFASLGELLLETHLRNALDRGELLMFYQPKVDARTGELVGAEALMRWQHPEHGMIPPGRFIPLAEECGLIAPMGEWALKAVCRQLRAWLDAGLEPVPIAVNVSAQQFAQHDVAQVVAQALAESRIPPELLELEMTESLLMKNAEHTAAVLGALKGMKIRMAIDDFGTGYSSLSYLKHFPVQVIKIDRMFVQDIDAEGEKVKLAAAIIALAHGMDLHVVAEGVETEAQRDYLARSGCDQFQGYLFDRPLPAEAFAERLKKRRS